MKITLKKPKALAVIDSIDIVSVRAMPNGAEVIYALTASDGTEIERKVVMIDNTQVGPLWAAAAGAAAPFAKADAKASGFDA